MNPFSLKKGIVFGIFCAIMLLVLVPQAQGLTARVSYTDPLIGRRGNAYPGSAGIEFEYDVILDEDGAQFYFGLGFTFFSPKEGPFFGTDNFGDYASISYGKIPMIPLIVGIRRGFFADAKIKPYLGLNFGYYFCYYDEKTSSNTGQNGTTVVGGMIGGAPCAGLMLNYDKRLSFGLDCRMHFMGDVPSEFFFSYLDTGIFVNYGLW